MGRFKCYDIAESVIDEPTKQFHGMIESPKGKELLKSLCDKIDTFIESVDADGFSVVIDDKTTEISLYVSCPEFVIEDNHHSLLNVLSSSAEFCVRKSEDIEDDVEFQFIIPGIWYVE